jgi:beta-lactamase regulating signal transducer with metallopeptidase domain
VAVITHELLHVQRRDWCWLLGEELLRTALWFQPAIWWATSRIQQAREELVDELTVLATGNRRGYIEALLAFADAGQVRPAAAFARRAHLFARIVELSNGVS